MQRSLDNFAGFKVNKKQVADFFNPFMNEPVSQDLVKPAKVIQVTNILDAPPTPEPIVTLEAPIKAPVVSLFPTSEEHIEMIQPRAKDGTRLLYKYPKIPKVGVKGVYSLLVGESDRSETAWLIQFDGAANPNPGPASSGAVLWSPKDLDGRRNPVFESGKYLGKATNNIAEVQGLLLGLQIAATRGAREILIEGDSELIIFQQTGRYRA